MKNSSANPSWKTWSATTGAIAVVFIIVILLLTQQSRRGIRQQILDRDGHVLHAVARMLSSTDKAADDLAVVLQTSRLRGVLGVRLFDGYGEYILSVPMGVAETRISPDHTARLNQGEPVVEYYPHLDLYTVFPDHPQLRAAEPAAVQMVTIPLQDSESNETNGIVQYLINGEPVRREFAQLDRTLFLQAGLALAFSLIGLFTLASLAYFRLTRSHRALLAQKMQLLHANRELSLAARTSSIGAVTSHLIHGIRNTLSSIDLFMQVHKSAPSTLSPEVMQQLSTSTRQVKKMVEDVVEVLRQQDMTGAFELSLEEMNTILHEQISPKAARADVRFETECKGSGSLPGHSANIILLILTNLIDNALSLVPAGRKTWVKIMRDENVIHFLIGDEGPGIPEAMQRQLFIPGKSVRPGGTGLGLAISHRLAAHINAELSLVHSNHHGTLFALRYPLGSDESAADEKDQRVFANSF